MTSAVTHPLEKAYLRDLELLLHGVDASERAEVLAGVHEHLDATLPPGSSIDDVRGVLAELGSPQSVADEAYAGRSSHAHAHAPAPAPAAASRPRPSPWTAHVACFLNGAGLALLAFLTLLSLVTSGVMAPHASELVFMAAAFVIPWFFLTVLTSMSDVWGSADKFRSILLYPATLAALGVTTWLVGLAGIGVVTLLAAMLVLAAAAWALSRLIRSARA